MSKIEPSKIYDFVIDKVEAMKSHAQSVSDDSVGASGDESASIESKKRKEQLAQARASLQNFESKAIKSVEDYKSVAEFDTFTIAFYGETNAGKSTIIEALRIYFGESSKQNERAKFEAGIKQYNGFIENVMDIQSKVRTLEANAASLQEELDKCNYGFFEKIFAFFDSNSVLSKTRKAKKALKAAKKIEAKIQTQLETYSKSSAFKEILFSGDGAIIGDGRADFTRKTSNYHFSHNGADFDILDVPGIEGKENAVIDEILKATKKAHCVFYITRNPQPPQKGDSPKGKAKGTIEKIKEHLGAQTEVYSIFNKSITSPSALSDSIIQQSDESGLNDLDKKMKDELGGHYAGRKTLSAQVAFYALGEKIFDIDLAHNSDEMAKAVALAKKRDKFINKYSKDELLQKSLFLDFANFISDDLAQNVEAKIKKSNFNKVHRILLGLSETLEHLNKIYGDLYEKCDKEVGDSCGNIGRIVDGASGAFESASDSVIDDFSTRVRDEMYRYIETDVKDSEFKKRFESVIEREQKTIGKKFEEAFECVQEDLQTSLDDELENLQRRMGNVAKEIQGVSMKNAFDSNLDIRIDSGIEKVGLLGALAGGGILAFTGAGAAILATGPITGPILLALSIGALVFGALKAVLKFLSKAYKMSQQRKVVDENLSAISYNMREKSLEATNESIEKNPAPYCESIKTALKNSVENIKKTSEYCIQLNENEIKPLAMQIKNEGGL